MNIFDICLATTLLGAIYFLRYLRFCLRRYQRHTKDLRYRYNLLKIEHLRDYQEQIELLSAMEITIQEFKKLLDAAYNPTKTANFIQIFRNSLSAIVDNESTFVELRYVVDKKHHGMVCYLRQRHPQLTDYEVNMLCMLQCGFSYDNMRLLYHHQNMYSIYSRRTKIHKKLELPQHYRIETYLSDLAAELKRQNFRFS